jgi:hypothetical protein
MTDSGPTRPAHPTSSELHGYGKLEPCGIRVDENGDWYYEGSRIFRPDILEILYEKLDRLPTGEFTLSDSKGRFLLEVEDTPFVVSRVDLEKDGSGCERIVIRFKNIPRMEVLDPATLKVGKQNVLYCRVFEGRYAARFSRPAYYQIAGFVREDLSGRGFYLELNGRSYYIN